jgi:hypothetical protein
MGLLLGPLMGLSSGPFGILLSPLMGLLLGPLVFC